MEAVIFTFFTFFVRIDRPRYFFVRVVILLFWLAPWSLLLHQSQRGRGFLLFVAFGGVLGLSGVPVFFWLSVDSLVFFVELPEDSKVGLFSFWGFTEAGGGGGGSNPDPYMQIGDRLFIGEK